MARVLVATVAFFAQTPGFHETLFTAILPTRRLPPVIFSCCSEVVVIIDHSGFLKGVAFIPSPNVDERPPEMPIRLLVIHSISLPPQQFGGNGVIQFFTNQLDPAIDPYYTVIKDLRVSAHFLIRRDGKVIQFVSCNLRAWHAGQSEWNRRIRCNDFAVGIEMEGSDYVAFEDAQYDTLIELTQAIQAAYPIQDIVGHADIALGRKTDPGPFFDWTRYRGALGTIENTGSD